jgi:hypothetical protein
MIQRRYFPIPVAFHVPHDTGRITDRAESRLKIIGRVVVDDYDFYGFSEPDNLRFRQPRQRFTNKRRCVPYWHHKR